MSVHDKRKNVVLKIINLVVELIVLPKKLLSKKTELSEISPKKILLLRLDHIGDVVMTSPAFSVLRAKFPHAKILLLTDAAGKQLYKKDPGIDDVLIFNWPWIHQKSNNRFTYAKFKELVMLIGQLRREHIDLCIDFRGDLRFVILFGVLGGAKIRIGNNRTGQTSLLHYSSVYDKSKHEVERALDVLNCFAKPSNTIRPSIILEESEIDSIKDIVKKETKFFFSEKTAIIAPYSSQKIKSWPVNYFAGVIRHLHLKGYTSIIVGTKDDIPDSQLMIKGLNASVYSFAGKTSVRELAALVSVSSIVIGVDTGVLHIASCFNIPIVAIFGATRSVEFRPYSPYTKVVESGTCRCNRFLHLKCDYSCSGYAMCLQNTTPQMVIQSIDAVMQAEVTPVSELKIV